MTHIKCPCINYPLCACAGCIPLTPTLHKDADSNNIYQMIIEQNPERRSQQSKQERINSALNEIATGKPFQRIPVDNDIFDEVIQQANEMCNAWVERAETEEPPTEEWSLSKQTLLNEHQLMNAAKEKVRQFSDAVFERWVEQENTEHRKPVTSFDWELQQALIHLQNAISVTDSRRAHLLQAAVSIVKGVRESD